MKVTKLEHTHLVSDITGLHNIIRGGRGSVLLEGPGGTSHLYLFEKPADVDAFPDDIIFVYAVHEDRRFYVGMVENNQFRLTRHSRFHRDTEIVKGAYYLLKLYNNSELFARTKMRLYSSGRCSVCGRQLYNSKFVSQCVGKRCKKYVGT